MEGQFYPCANANLTWEESWTVATNQNRFKSKFQCLNACGCALVHSVVVLPSLSHPHSGVVSDGERCLADPEMTTRAYEQLKPLSIQQCFQKTTKFYFDVSKGKCLPFLYRGCHATNNFFQSSSQCAASCASETTLESSRNCLKPKDEGWCTRSAVVFSEDEKSCKNQTFRYCQEWENNWTSKLDEFGSIEGCSAACSK